MSLLRPTSSWAMPAQSPSKMTKLEENSTDANVKQIEDKEKSIAEKKIAWDKHCRHFGLRYGKYGTEESGVRSDATNGQVSVVLTSARISTDVSFQANAMTNGNAEHVTASADINMAALSPLTLPPTLLSALLWT